MNKKIIAVLAAATIVFVCVFAACGKNSYTNPQTGKKYEIVTDDDGKRVLNDDGELVVYATDDNGKYVTDENGEKVTQGQAFIGQIEVEDNVFEDYAYKLTLADGWKADKDTFGEFANKSKKQEVSVSIVESVYSDYYNKNLETYNTLKDGDIADVEVSWEDDLDLVKGAQNACRFIMQTDDVVRIMYLFENSSNVYKILFTSDTKDGAVEDSEAFCKGFVFKPYTYYPDVTSATEAE